jgi:hypothetical protein
LAETPLKDIIILWQKNELRMVKGRSGLPYYELKIPDMLEKYMILISMLVKGHGKTKEFLEERSTVSMILSMVTNEDHRDKKALEWWQKQARKWWEDAIIEFFKEDEQNKIKTVIDKPTFTVQEATANISSSNDINSKIDEPYMRISKEIDRSLLTDIAKPKRVRNTALLDAIGADSSEYKEAENE